MAVLSCALALLAVNPAGLRTAQASPVPLMRVQGSLPASEPLLSESAVVDITEPLRPGRLDSRKSKAAAKAHISQQGTILQTVALLNAALVSHFTPLTPQAVLSPVMQWPITHAAAAVRLATNTGSSPLPQSAERTFSLLHCLLAPPV